jgi:hypothetical protein
MNYGTPRNKPNSSEAQDVSSLELISQISQPLSSIFFIINKLTNSIFCHGLSKSKVYVTAIVKFMTTA